MSEKEKNIKMLMRHQRLLKQFLITIKMLTKSFSLHQKLIKKSELKFEKSSRENKIKRQKRITEIEKEEKNIYNELFNNTLINIKIQVICINDYVRQKEKK